MKKVYKHKRLAPDIYLGRVEDDGKIYKNTGGPRKPDNYIGRVELNSGKVYDAESGPEKYVGHVELDSGKVFLARLGTEDYVGKVTDKGRFYHHKRMAFDDYLGKIKDMTSYAYGGAAFLLLALPAFEAELQEKEQQTTQKKEAAAQ